MMGWHAIKELSNKPLLIPKARHSLVPRPFPPPVFDHLQYKRSKTSSGNGLGSQASSGCRIKILFGEAGGGEL